MNIPIFILAVAFMLLTLLICFAGIFVMASGKEISKKYSSKLMKARVILQFITLILVALAFV